MPLHSFYGASASSRHLQWVDFTSRTGFTATITTPATTFTNSSITEIVASTPFDTNGIWVTVNTSQNTTGVRVSTLLDILIGASGSEQMLIGPLSIGGHPLAANFWFPIFIPAGSRLSIRARSAYATRGMSVRINFSGSPNTDTVSLPQRWVAYGLVDDSSNAQGTALSLPASPPDFGNWTNLSSSTTYAHDLWMVTIDRGADTALPSTGGGYLQLALNGTSSAANELTNNTTFSTCNFDCRGTNTLSSWVTPGQALTYPFQFGCGPLSPLIYAPKPAGSTIDVRAFLTTTFTSYALGASVLAAI
jgi:hypothetical protein